MRALAKQPLLDVHDHVIMSPQVGALGRGLTPKVESRRGWPERRGKSTLIKAILGLVPATSAVRLFGSRWTPFAAALAVLAGGDWDFRSACWTWF